MSCSCDGSVESGLLCFGKELFDNAWFEVFFECGFEVAECVGVDVCGVGGVHGGLSLVDAVGVFFEVFLDLVAPVEDVALAWADAVPVVVAGPAAQCVGAAAEKFAGFFRVEVWGVVHRGIPYAAVSSTWSNHAAM